MDTRLTLKQAYMSMFEFLKAYYLRKGEPDELGVLLGGIQPLGHLLGRTDEEDINRLSTADPASWYDWLEAVAAVLNQDDQKSSGI